MEGPPALPPGGLATVGRLLVFVGATAALTLVLGALLPAGLEWGGVALGVAALAVSAALTAVEGRGPAAIGLVLDRAVPGEALAGVGAGLLVAAAAVAAIALGGGIAWGADDGGVLAFAGGGAVWLLRLAVPAAAEEIALRGYLLQVAARRWGAGPALVGTSAVFGLLHAGNPDAGPGALAGVTAAGLFLGALALRTGSLWGPIGAHLGWNWALAWPADLPVSGLDLADAPLIDAAVGGPAWWTGGAFGPEAGLAAVLAFGAAAVVAWRRAVGPRAGRPATLSMDFERRDRGIDRHDG